VLTQSVKRLDYGLDERVSIPSRGNDVTFFSSPPRPNRLWGPSPGVKPPGRKAYHSPPSSAEVSNAWSYTSISPVRLDGVGLS